MQQVLEFTVGDEVKVVPQKSDGKDFLRFINNANLGWVRVRKIIVYSKGIAREIRDSKETLYDPDSDFVDVFLEFEKPTQLFTFTLKGRYLTTLPAVYVKKAGSYSDGLENWI